MFIEVWIKQQLYRVAEKHMDINNSPCQGFAAIEAEVPQADPDWIYYYAYLLPFGSLYQQCWIFSILQALARLIFSSLSR